MNKFLVVSLVMLSQIVQVAQGAAGAGAGKDAAAGAEGIRIAVNRTSQGMQLSMTPEEFRKLGVTPAQVQASLDKIKTNGISPEDYLKFQRTMLGMTDAQIEGMGHTRQKIELHLKVSQAIRQIYTMMDQEGANREALMKEVCDIQDVCNSYNVGEPKRPEHGTLFAEKLYDDLGRVIQDMRDRGIGMYRMGGAAAPDRPLAHPMVPTAGGELLASAGTATAKSSSTGAVGRGAFAGLRGAFGRGGAAAALADPLSHIIGEEGLGPDMGGAILEGMGRMSFLQKQATRPDGSYDMAAMAAGMRSMGMPANLTSEGKIDIDPRALGMPPSSSSGPDLSDTFYTPLPNGDRLASDGVLYKPVGPGDEMRILINGGRIAPDGTQYYAVKPSGGTAAALGDDTVASEAAINRQLEVLLPPKNEEGRWSVLLSTQRGFEDLCTLMLDKKFGETKMSSLKSGQALKAKLQLLREGYGLFQTYETNPPITPEDVVKIRAAAARIIASGPVGGFGKAQVDKAKHIALRYGFDHAPTEEERMLGINVTEKVAKEGRALPLSANEEREKLVSRVSKVGFIDLVFAGTAAAPSHTTLQLPDGTTRRIKVEEAARALIENPGAAIIPDNFSEAHAARVAARAGSVDDGLGSRGCNPLTQAIYDKNKAEIKRLIADSSAVNAPDSRGRTPLFMAVGCGDLDTVNLLLSRGARASVNEPDETGATPLLRACANGNTELARLLLANGAATSVNTHNEGGDTPLLMACYKGSTELARLLLENDAASVNTASKNGITPLLGACIGNNIELARLLLRYGAATSVNTADKNGFTPLLSACFQDSLPLVQFLLANGAVESMNTPDSKGRTPLTESIRRTTDGITLALLQAGADVNKAANGRTPLSLAAEFGGIDIMDRILDRAVAKGLDQGAMHAPDGENMTPLLRLLTRKDATEKGPSEDFCYRASKMLLNKGGKVSINHAGPKGSALLGASAKGYASLVTLFLANGAKESVNTPDEDGMTPLMASMVLLNKEVITSLLDSGADPSLLSAENTTALMLCIGRLTEHGESLACEAAKMLLTYGARPEQSARTSINQRNVNGETALVMAIDIPKSLPMVNLLLEYGADPTVGAIMDGPMLDFAVVNRLGPIANALMFNLKDKPMTIYPAMLYGVERQGIKPSTGPTVVHVIAQGDGADGGKCKANMARLLTTAGGLKALNIKDENGRLPEDIMANPELKGQMHKLRQDYEAFQLKLRLDISKNTTQLNLLEDIAKHIVDYKENFPEREWLKAQRILTQLAAAKCEAKIAEAVTNADATIDQLFNLVDRKAKKDKVVAECESFKGQYAAAVETAGDMAIGRSSLAPLRTRIRQLLKKNNATVNAALAGLVPAADEPDAAASAGAGAAAVGESAFDVETADLDVETLEALSTASGVPRKKIEQALTAMIREVEAGARALEQPTEIVSEADVRQALKDKYATASDAERKATWDKLEKSALKRYRERLKKTTGYSKSLEKLEYALNHGVHPKLIWQILRYAKDVPLCKLHQQVEAMDRTEAGTYVSGSKYSSLGDGISVGSAFGDRGGDFDGFGDVAKIGKEGAVDFEADPSLRAAVSIPVFPLPSDLDDNHIRTLQKLFGRGLQDVRDLAANGAEIHALFNALGDRFEAAYDKEATKAGNLRLTDKAAGSASGSGWDATVIVDPKHVTEEFKGPKRHLVNRAASLLERAGVTKEVLDALARRRGLLGVAAMPAAAGAGSPT